MKAASISEIKNELAHLPPQELRNLCLRLAKFKLENKELLTYLLFQEHNEEEFIRNIMQEVALQFSEMNSSHVYFIKKSIRKIGRFIQKNIRYSGNKQTEVALNMHYYQQIVQMKNYLRHRDALESITSRQVAKLKKLISVLHEDLQYDYLKQLDAFE